MYTSLKCHNITHAPTYSEEEIHQICVNRCSPKTFVYLKLLLKPYFYCFQFYSTEFDIICLFYYHIKNIFFFFEIKVSHLSLNIIPDKLQQTRRTAHTHITCQT